MFLDASALTSMLLYEDDWSDLVARMARHDRRITSAVAVWETAVAVARRLVIEPSSAQDQVYAYLERTGIDIVAVTAESGSMAIEAFARYGKGRHPAALNMSDCFAYACARTHRVPLLYKGQDFSRTDIERA